MLNTSDSLDSKASKKSIVYTFSYVCEYRKLQQASSVDGQGNDKDATFANNKADEEVGTSSLLQKQLKSHSKHIC